MSLTDEAANPIRSPISASVMPVDRSSEIREAQVVAIDPSIRESVHPRQRRPVTAFRENDGMPRPKEMPSGLDTIGKRVRWWRVHRGHGRKEFAQLCRMSVTALSDLELDRTKKGSSLHLIAAQLRLNAYYLETGKGEPESEYAQEAPAEPPAWPFAGVTRTQIDKLNPIERKYAEVALQQALSDIETERRKAKKTG